MEPSVRTCPPLLVGNMFLTSEESQCSLLGEGGDCTQETTRRQENEGSASQ